MPDYDNDIGYDDPSFDTIDAPPDFSTLPLQPLPFTPADTNTPIDWSAIDKILGGAAGLIGGKGGGAGDPKTGGLYDIWKALGLSDKSGGLDIGSLLAIAALFGGSLNQSNSVKEASQQMQEAANKANDLATSTINGASAGYKPYMDAGVDALGKMQAFNPPSLASQFHAAGTPSNLAAAFANGGGSPSNLAGQFKSKMTLADLARR